MNKRVYLLISAVAVMALTGCHKKYNPPTYNSGSTTQQSESLSSQSVISSEQSISSSSEISVSKISKSEAAEDRKISIYTVNDFHGQIKELASSYEAGAGKYFSYLDRMNKQGNTLLINSGDLYQGSLESNYNRGHMLTDIMNYCQFDSFTLGNHEFDWGQEYITINKDCSYETKYKGEYRTPFLAANIYDFDIKTKKVGIKQQSQLGQEYTISTLENGLKVGIIGTIGTDQITSISSQNVDNLTFIDPIAKTKELSNKLRLEEGVDFVVGSFHAGISAVANTGLTSISPTTGEKYCDAILTAHTHSGDYDVENGVPIIQAYSNGKDIGNLEFTVKKDGTVVYDGAKTKNLLQYTDLKEEPINPDIQEIIDAYALETNEVGNEVLTTFSGRFSQSTQVPNIMVEAMYKEAIAQGFTPDFAMSNTGRASIQAGDVTYSSLFNAVPFDNEVMIVKCSGEDLIKEAKYNSVYRGIPDKVEESKTYTVAILDYLATHRNSRRDYDYFPTMELIGSLKKDGKIFNYRDTLAKHLRTKSNWVSSNYEQTNPRFNSTLTSAVTFND
ncbi:MAG: 5'-nucleotidase C-terminal domain-containing protein [Bacilli bacterium]|nr:5'-nucleotidase C-terminal domain-containing protein [Bacilli bacterium]